MRGDGEGWSNNYRKEEEGGKSEEALCISIRVQSRGPGYSGIHCMCFLIK